MKKFFLWILMVLVFLALILGGTGLYFYMTTDEADLNIPCLMAETTAVPPAQGDMQLPVMSGVFYKHLAWVNDFSQPYVVPVSSDKLPLQLPEGAQGLKIEISLENRPVFSGDLAAYENFAFTANGDYKYRVTAALAAPDAGERPRAYGSYTYAVQAHGDIAKIETCGEPVAQDYAGHNGQHGNSSRHHAEAYSTENCTDDDGKRFVGDDGFGDVALGNIEEEG